MKERTRYLRDYTGSGVLYEETKELGPGECRIKVAQKDLYLEQSGWMPTASYLEHGIVTSLGFTLRLDGVYTFKSVAGEVEFNFIANREPKPKTYEVAITS